MIDASRTTIRPRPLSDLSWGSFDCKIRTQGERSIERYFGAKRKKVPEAPFLNIFAFFAEKFDIYYKFDI